MGTRAVRLWALVVLAAIVGPASARADTPQFVRFATSLGNIDVQLLPQYAPKTVANFLSYVQSGAYAQTFFDRSVPNFVIQGGSYYVDGGTIRAIPTQPAVTNEPQVSNTRGTLAMAKKDGQPNSATDAWFFNLADNSSNLNNQNGGFTVFGTVVSPKGLAVMDAIAAEPVYSNTSSPFNGFPLQNFTTGQTPTTANLIMSPIAVLSDDTPPTITITAPTAGQHFAFKQAYTPQFTCDDGPGTGVKSCTADSNPLDTSTFGQRSFTVTASDYAGNTSSRTVAYVVDPPPGVGGGGSGNPPPASAVPTLSGRLTVSPTGRLPISLRCRSTSRCRGKLTLYAPPKQRHGRPTVLGSARYSIAAGRMGRVSLLLARTALTLLRQHSGALKVSLALAPSGGRTKTASVQLRLGRR